MGAVAAAAPDEPRAEAPPVAVYRPRQPRGSPLYRRGAVKVAGLRVR
jgi:hypothetical protein